MLGRMRGWIGMALAAMLLGACGGDDITALVGEPGPQPTCPASATFGDFCGGGVLVDTAYAGSVYLVAHTTDFTGQLWKIDKTATANAADSGDGRLNTGTFNVNHPASFACQNLVAGGAADWYLPAGAELQAIMSRAATQPTFNITFEIYYWSSTEVSGTPTNASSRRYSAASGVQAGSSTKTSTTLRTRCVRRTAVE